MRFTTSLVAASLAAGCGDGAREGVDAGTVDAIDAGAETVEASAPDTASASDGTCACLYGFCTVPAYCEAAVPLTPTAPSTMQDTTSGGRGDCAVHASGLGGRNLYYTLEIPPGVWARVVARPLDPDENALVRVLSDCAASATEGGSIGGKITEGRAELCVRGGEGAARRVVLAVARYSGEAADLTIRFDLSVELVPFSVGCSP